MVHGIDIGILADRPLMAVLVSLVALILGSVGMAASVTMFLNGQIETVGILRCLGLGPGDVARLYHGLCLALGVPGGLPGAVAGWGLGLSAPCLYKTYVNRFPIMTCVIPFVRVLPGGPKSVLIMPPRWKTHI